MSYFSKNIRFLRARHGLKQSDMREKVGIARTTWSCYENEVSQPDIDGIIKIARFFDVNVDELLKVDLEEKAGPVQKKTARKREKQPKALPETEESLNSIVLEIVQAKKQIIETQQQIILALHTLADRLHPNHKNL